MAGYLRLLAHDLHMIRVGVGTDHMPQPAGSGARARSQLCVPLLAAIDIEHRIAIRIRIDRLLSRCHRTVRSVFLIEGLTACKLQHIGLRAYGIVVSSVKDK